MPFDPMNPLSSLQMQPPGGPNAPINAAPPSPPQGGLQQSASNSSDLLEKTQYRLTGDESYLEKLMAESQGTLDKLAAKRDTATDEQVKYLNKESEYSTLDKVMAGLAGMSLDRVPRGYSSLAIGMQGTRDAATKFAEMKGAYKQKALDLQAQAAQKAYEDQWQQQKLLQQQAQQTHLQNMRDQGAEKRLAMRNASAEAIANAKAKAADKGIPNTLITNAHTTVAAMVAQYDMTPKDADQAFWRILNDSLKAKGMPQVGPDDIPVAPLGGQPTQPQGQPAPQGGFNTPYDVTWSGPMGAPGSTATDQREGTTGPIPLGGEVASTGLGKPVAGEAPHPDMAGAPLPPGMPANYLSTRPSDVNAAKKGKEEAAQKKAAAGVAAEASLVPGTPEYNERVKSEREQAKYSGEILGDYNGAIQSADLGIGNVDEILNPENASGFEGSFGGWNAYITQFGAGNTAKVQSKLNSLKSSMKAAGLKLIRQGGSIGQMTEKEWPIVEGMIADLTPKLDEADAEALLSKIRAFFVDFKHKAKEEYRVKGGGVHPSKDDELRAKYRSQQ